MNLSKYIGLPYEPKGRSEAGIDCWGLVQLFYRNEFGITLPSYKEEYISPTDKLTVSQAISKNLSSWVRVTSAPAYGHILIFNIIGLPLHTGVYVGNNDFLHAFKETNSCIERLNSVTWNRRLAGIYKWVRT